MTKLSLQQGDTTDISVQMNKKIRDLENDIEKRFGESSISDSRYIKQIEDRV